MVGPVGVDDPDLGDGGVTPLAREILAAEARVVCVHGQAALGDKLCQLCVVPGAKAVKNLHVFWGREVLGQRARLVQPGKARLHGVHHVGLHALHVLGRERPFERVHGGRAHERPLFLADELHALAGRLRPLVELAGQVLHGKHSGPVQGGQLVCDIVRLRLRKDRGHAGGERRLVHALHVVAVEQAQAGEARYAHDVAQLLGKGLRLDVEPGLFLYVDP